MSTTSRPQTPLDQIRVGDRENFHEGPPVELFRRLRSECPVHWTDGITEYPDEAGFWSVTTADDVYEVSRDWKTYSSELGGFVALRNAILPLELQQAMFIGMDPPKHDRIKALFQRGFTPKRIAEHEDAIRAITIEVLDRLEGRDRCDLVTDVAQPSVARVIGSFMGLPQEDDEIWARLMRTIVGAGDPDMTPEGAESVMEVEVPEVFERCSRLIAERRETPTDDLTSVLVHAEIDGEKLEDHEIVMGFFLLMAAGNDSTKATYSSGMRALLESPEQGSGSSRTPRSCRPRWRSRCACSPRSRTSRAPPPRTPSCTARRSARARRWSCGTRPPTAMRPASRTPTASTSPARPSTRRSARAAGTSASAPRSRASSCGS